MKNTKSISNGLHSNYFNVNNLKLIDEDFDTSPTDSINTNPKNSVKSNSMNSNSNLNGMYSDSYSEEEYIDSLDSQGYISDSESSICSEDLKLLNTDLDPFNPNDSINTNPLIAKQSTYSNDESIAKQSIDVNWDQIDEKIKNINFPLLFIIEIIKKQRHIEDYKLSFLVRLLFKNKFSLCYNYPLFLIFNHLDSRFEITRKVVNEFYVCLMKKVYFIDYILNCKKTLSNTKIFNTVWGKSNPISVQKENFENILLFFKAHFDASKSGLEGATRLITQLKSSFIIYSKPDEFNPILFEIKDRFSRLNSFFGEDFFKERKIIIISEEEFNKLKNTDKIKYILYFYLKNEKFFNKIVNSYELLLAYHLKILQIVDPKPIFIDIDEESLDSSDSSYCTA